jgi:glucoamylase
MDWEFGSATNGNIALMGETDLRLWGGDGELEFTLAFGIGEGHHTAAQKTMGALATPFEEHREPVHHAVEAGGESGVAGGEGLRWRQADAGQPQRAAGARRQDVFRRVCGIGVDSLGAGEGRRRPGRLPPGVDARHGADGDRSAGLRTGGNGAAGAGLPGLHATADGGLRRTSGSTERLIGGQQLDEVAFPLILAWRLWKANALGELRFSVCGAGGGLSGAHAPITHQERWEENAGYSPSTLAAVIGGLICAAEIARAHDSTELAVFLEEFADWIEKHLEDWTVTNDGVLHPDVKRHYMRIRPPESGEAYACEELRKEIIRLRTGRRDAVEFEAREIIDAGFLELVRYGVRRADDPLMVDSLKVVDAVLKRDLPQGPGWLRYNWDGYGSGPTAARFRDGARAGCGRC